MMALTQGHVVRIEWKTMSIEELSELHQLMQSVLHGRLLAKKKRMEAQLLRLNEYSDNDGGSVGDH